MGSRIRIALCSVLIGAASCVSSYKQHVNRGDSAAAVQDWKQAVAAYQAALAEKPNSPELQTKYNDARTKAVAVSLATAERCSAGNDFACVDLEVNYVLGLEPGNQDAGRIRMAASNKQAIAAIDNAQKAASIGDFVKAYQWLDNSRSLTSDAALAERAMAVAGQIAPAAATYAVSLSTQSEAAPIERKVVILAECRDILTRVVPHLPEHMTLLATVKTQFDSASVEKQRYDMEQAQLLQQQDAERARLAEQHRVAAEKEAAVQRAAAVEVARDKSRTVSLVGAVIGPGVSDGTNWDGSGHVDPTVARAVIAALAGSNPYTAVLGLFAGPAMRQMSKPDVFGTATLFVSGRPVASFDLDFQRDTFTPQWEAAIWNDVDITNARLRVTLTDKDALANDSIGVGELDGTELKAAQQAGRVVPFVVATETSNQILFLRISVM